MKKLILSLFAFGIISTGISQAVSDRTTVPLAVNLNQVLRLNIMQGGNLEFTFNTIADYENGKNAAAAGNQNTGANTGAGTTFTDPAAAPPVAGNAAGFYITQFTVASSNNWEIHMGAEDANLIGTDNSTNVMTLDNIGYSITADGTHTFAATGVGAVAAANAVLMSTPTGNGANITRLHQFPGTAALVKMETAVPPVNEGNAGDIGDNSFSVYWRVGTKETDMNQVALINQNLPNDRYVTNVLFDLQLSE
jgi:hypothetical protein